MMLSKSRYLAGLSCPKLLWVSIHRKDILPHTGEDLEYIFSQGKNVGELAKRLYPEGIDIPSDDLGTSIATTRKLMPSGKPLFEAAFQAGDLYSRVDILMPEGDGFEIIEVKSSGSVKEEHIHDVAFQRHCMQSCGHKVVGCHLMHIDTSYVRGDDVDPLLLFKKQDITAEVEEAISDTRARASDLLSVIKQADIPDIAAGEYCTRPKECGLGPHCFGKLPADSVFTLTRGGKRSLQLYLAGIHSIAEIPEGQKLTEKQAIQRGAAVDGAPHMDAEKVKAFLDSLEYPLIHMDFETVNPAIPMYPGTRPYQQIPFQYSCHLQKERGSKPIHSSFLANGGDDPRPAFLSSLKADIGDPATILVYNKSFEIARLKELARDFPENEPWISAAIARIADLMDPFHQFHYYHPLQCGSFSMKAVLPALTGKGYADMEIGEGGKAAREYLRVTYGDVDGQERARVRKLLEEYCCQDTEGMADIMAKLYAGL